MHRSTLAVTLLAAVLASCSHHAATDSAGTNGSSASGGTNGGRSPNGFASATIAQKHCRGDLVVWLNLTSHVYHEPGSPYYGKTQHGAYVCRREAVAEGDRAAKNGT